MPAMMKWVELSNDRCAGYAASEHYGIDTIMGYTMQVQVRVGDETYYIYIYINP